MRYASKRTCMNWKRTSEILFYSLLFLFYLLFYLLFSSLLSSFLSFILFYSIFSSWVELLYILLYILLSVCHLQNYNDLLLQWTHWRMIRLLHNPNQQVSLRLHAFWFSHSTPSKSLARLRPTSNTLLNFILLLVSFRSMNLLHLNNNLISYNVIHCTTS